MKAHALVLLVATGCVAASPDPVAPSTDAPWIDPAQREADLADLCEVIRARYVYAERSVGSWPACEATFTARIRAADTPIAFLHVLEDVVATLQDHHAGLSTHGEGSPVPVPTLADLWLETVGSDVVVTSVRPGSSAEDAGVRAGAVVRAIDGVPVEQFASDAAMRVAAAGARGQASRTLTLDADVAMEAFASPERDGLVSARKEGSVGVLRINNALGDGDLVPAFDAALAGLGEVSGLILDLRDTPSGGNTDVAEPILGRFVDAEVPYQRLGWKTQTGGVRAPRSMIALIVPRTDRPTYRGPLVVLVSRWTGSMGEGMAVGLAGAKRATVVGTRMAGLAGAVESHTLPHSGMSVQFPVGTIHTLDGTPRESWEPQVLIDMTTASGPDPVFTAGLEALATSPTLH
ncbi:MAG: S41 family peptidase [Myxococcota bacterium]